MVDEPRNSPYSTGTQVLSRHIGGISGGILSRAALEVKIMRCLALSVQSRDRCVGKKHEHLHYYRFVKRMCEDHVGEFTKRGW